MSEGLTLEILKSAADEGEVPEVSHEMTEVSEDVSEVPESPPGRVPARRSKRARRG